MARFTYLIGIVLLFTACAEVGTISGGPEDEFAPKPIAARCEPQNGSVNFHGQQIVLEFDEFFKLNDPGNNIRMVPPHAHITPQMKGKTLVLRWEEQLEPNITYAIYLNNAVSDITENNDTIIQYVFSTGPSLDTLFYDVAIADAWTGKPVKGCTVGLYNPENGEIQSLAETDRRGLARLTFLRAGDYQLLAFLDKNKDLQLQVDEALAFPEAPEISVQTGFVFDSLPLRMFTPTGEPGLRTIRPEFPGLLTLAADEGLMDATFTVRGKAMEPANLRWLGTDSVLVPIDLGEDEFIEVSVQSSLLNDTVRVRANRNDRTKRVNLRPTLSSGLCSPQDSAELWCNDWILSVDTSKFSVLDARDSSRLSYTVSFEHNALQFHFTGRNSLDKVLVNLQPGAVRTVHGESPLTVFQFTFQAPRKYGALLLDLSGYAQSVILHIVRDGKTIRELRVADPSTAFRAEYIDPGDYTFVVVRDANGNGRWDVGNYSLGLQPEMVDRYSEAVKVRANWDVETALIPQGTP